MSYLQLVQIALENSFLNMIKSYKIQLKTLNNLIVKKLIINQSLFDNHLIFDLLN